jgi:adenine-specific DNA-methyltransferase
MDEIKNNFGNSENSKNSGSDNVWMPLSNDWNKERLTQLKNLFPDLFTNDGKLNIDELKKVVDPASVSETERFEFRWFGKSEAKRNAYTPSNATLIYDEARSVNALSEPEFSGLKNVQNNAENFIIEGENLEVLKLLSAAYREQIKCIYIDPPYNTGKDFVYSDNYTEDKKPYWEQTGITQNGVKIDTNVDSDGRYHSNWLNMMYSRLLIARTLLREDGVIFISIDDNEVHNLRKLCDEVFGEDNFVSDIIWHSKYTTSNDAKYVSRQHEHILLYAKQLDEFEIGLLDRTEEMDNAYKNPDNDPNGDWKATPLHAKSGSESNIYMIEFPNGKTWTPPKGRYPRYSKSRLMDIYNDGGLYFNKNGGIDRKTYLSEVKQGKTTGSVWSFNEVGSSHQANEQLADIFGKGMFDNPKPTNLIKTCIKIANGEDGLIFDFFGGSGTTGQAVMELNKEDGGNRKFILVQIPEATDENSEAFKAGYKKISDITIERNKRVAEKIKSELQLQELKNKQNNPLFTNSENSANSKNHSSDNLGFKVFKLVKSNFPRVEWAPDVDKTEEENIATLKQYIADKEAQLITAFNRDELLTEILLKNGFQLNYKTDKQDQFKKNEILLATDGIKETLICLDVAIDADTVEHFKKHTDKKFICLERAMDTTKKYNLKHYLGDLFNAF